MKHRVIIIGAGAAGLIAARELSGKGHEVTLLEAQPRTGGRIHTQTLPGGGSLTNNGTISTGASPGVTSTGPGPVTITNNGTITSNTTGIQTTGNSSSTLTNNGTISVGSTVTSKGGAAKATVGTGISQQAGH